MSEDHFREPAAGCPHLTGYDPLSEPELEDPYPSWARARERAPIVYIPLLDRYLAVSYDAVRAILRDTERLSSRNVTELGEVPPQARDRLPNGYPIAYPALLNADPPRHATIRKLAQQAFTVRRVNSMEPTIRELARGLAAAIARAGEVELIEGFAVPLSSTVLARMLGFPDREAPRFREFSQMITELTSMVVAPARRLELSHLAADFQDYVAAMIEQRRAQQRDDLISALLRAEDLDGTGLSELNVNSIVAQLIVAGQETTATLIGNMVWLLLDERRRWERLRADRSLVPAAVEESLRRMAPIKQLTRTAVEDVEIEGVAVPRGARILVSFGAANADPERFPEPDRFDLDRESTAPHVAFGRGTHFCLGAPLARLEARVALECLLDRLPDLRPSATEPPVRAKTLSIHSFARLPLEVEPVASGSGSLAGVR